jgi:AbiV family abortive infection protein
MPRPDDRGTLPVATDSRRIDPGYAEGVDLRAVKAASRPELVAYAAAAAENAQHLLDDAQLLSDAGRQPRAYTLGVLSVEEFGKAVSLLTLAAMPENLRAQAPVRRLLECHQLKQVGGLLIAAVPLSEPGAARRLAAMPLTVLKQILDGMDMFVQDADQLKLRGLYVDMQRGARIRRPSEITQAEVSEQLCRARQVASSASLLRDREERARLADPCAEAIELARALVSAFAESGDLCKPGAAAAATLEAVREVQDHKAARAKPAIPAGSKRSSGRLY